MPDTGLPVFPAVMLFPGQGAQSLGMGKSLLENSTEAGDLLARAETLLDFPIGEILRRGPAKLMNRTDILQPCICTISAMAWAALQPLRLRPIVLAGHSLGELSAFHAAGAYEFGTLLNLATQRGKFMQQAADVSGGTMIAMNSCEDGIEEQLEELLSNVEPGSVCIANINSRKQAVLAGGEDVLAELSYIAPSMGLRPTRLPVSGPWHSKAMSPAAEAFRECLEHAHISDVACPVWSSLDCRPIQKSGDIRDQLAHQIDHTVNWLALMQRLRRDFHDAIWIELAPGKTLTGLLLDIDRSARIFRSETTVQMRRLQDQIAQRDVPTG